MIPAAAHALLKTSSATHVRAHNTPKAARLGQKRPKLSAEIAPSTMPGKDNRAAVGKPIAMTPAIPATMTPANSSTLSAAANDKATPLIRRLFQVVGRAGFCT